MMAVIEPSDERHQAEMWALARDDHMEHLLVWQRVKKRAEVGGFNGVMASDYRHAREALVALIADIESES
jgi:hypothetical protein